ncbi:glycosyltransferase [Nitrospinaceae bacterium]|nr:glycosyltransferase [Nitrospinaceae bacterium]
MNKPRVSVIMNCLNGEKYLREAIESAYAQTYKNWEIIFWDNASTDKSAEIAKSFDEKIRYFRSDENYCLGKARNLALAQAKGEFIAFLDCDDTWLPEKLEKQIPCFENNPEVALVFSDMMIFDGSRDIYQYLGKHKPPRGNVFRELLVNYFIGIVSVVIRKSAVKDIGWFDERFELIEDMDLFLRIAYLFKLDYVDEPLVKWRLHEKSTTFKKYGLFADEWDLLLEKLIGLYPDFKENYAKEIRGYASKTTQLRVLGEWLNHRPINARKLLNNTDLGKISRFGYLVLTFFPTSIFFPLYKLRYRIRSFVS